MSITIRDDETGQEYIWPWDSEVRLGQLQLLVPSSGLSDAKWVSVADCDPKPTFVTYGGITFEVGATRVPKRGDWVVSKPMHLEESAYLMTHNDMLAECRILTPVSIEAKP